MAEPADPNRCESCGKTGIVYILDGRYLCPACMSKHRPPLPYRGPERRRGLPNPLGFRRRATDSANAGRKKP
jgi:hypothetical protein